MWYLPERTFELCAYVTTLRSLTQGRAVPNVTPSHYEESADEHRNRDHRQSRRRALAFSPV